MLCKRKLTTTTLRQLRSMPTHTHQKKINLIAFLLCCMPFAFSVSLTLAEENKHKDDFVSNFLMGIQMFCFSLEHPTLTNMVALLYCVLCQRCYSFIGSLTQEVRNMSPTVLDQTSRFISCDAKQRLMVS
ncbi:uncharacterized protein CEXT_657851 [Caerostris extrusa]|uniref:Uncharacterized protein n=1 Tax=Caerostris extrusa TaxID=172846 RepID=A0AAV4WXL7_CAEEX|nr:uncharacterized protein CEXT_657851 [Caerostris extrusa]